MLSRVGVFSLLTLILLLSDSVNAQSLSLKVITIATRQTDGLQRLQRSARSFRLSLEIIGSDLPHRPAELDGAEKIRLLKQSLEKDKGRNDLVVLYTEADTSVLNGAEDEILKRFTESFPDSRIVFSASRSCFPDESLQEQYPSVKKRKRFLDSKSFIGYATDLFNLLESAEAENEIKDEQLIYTQLFLNEQIRDSLKLSIDSKSELLQSVDVSVDELRLDFSDNGDAYVTNTDHSTTPLIIHGDESSKRFMNYLGNYIGKAWSADFACRDCSGEKFDFLKDGEEERWPTLTLAIFIAKPIPFVEEFLEKVENMMYPKEKIDLYVYNNQKYNDHDINEFVRRARGKYHSVEWDGSDIELDERDARRGVIDSAIKASNEFVFLLDANVHFNNLGTLRSIIESSLVMNLGIVAPMVGKPQKLFTNFWADVNELGYYRRSEDYTEMVTFKRVGVWNVPYISSAILINKYKMREVRDAFFYNQDSDADMSFCEFARDKNHFLFVDNQHYYGFLADCATFDNSDERIHPEMYQIFENRHLWESRYIHPGYFSAISGNTEIEQPCPDVYDYPLMSERFASEMIEEMEHYGRWSDGSNRDTRLAGGYENVPTVDIHMNQIDFERHWLYFLDEYVRPMQEKLFIGYYQKPVEAIMMFVVRYKPGEQSFLRPHHDASTYTIDVPLNQRGRDFEGGGVRYVRYNCTVNADRVGYAAMFPGRLTHLHEGLTVTKGTRYIAVSFLNP